VVAKLQTFRQLAHRDAVASGKTLDGQQRLMLLRGDASLARGRLAKTQELPERVSKRGQCFILRFDQLLGFATKREYNTPALEGDVNRPGRDTF
jgi:hypothetical protein